MVEQFYKAQIQGLELRVRELNNEISSLKEELKNVKTSNSLLIVELQSKTELLKKEGDIPFSSTQAVGDFHPNENIYNLKVYDELKKTAQENTTLKIENLTLKNELKISKDNLAILDSGKQQVDREVQNLKYQISLSLNLRTDIQAKLEEQLYENNISEGNLTLMECEIESVNKINLMLANQLSKFEKLIIEINELQSKERQKLQEAVAMNQFNYHQAITEIARLQIAIEQFEGEKANKEKSSESAVNLYKEISTDLKQRVLKLDKQKFSSQLRIEALEKEKLVRESTLKFLMDENSHLKEKFSEGITNISTQLGFSLFDSNKTDGICSVEGHKFLIEKFANLENQLSFEKQYFDSFCTSLSQNIEKDLINKNRELEAKLIKIENEIKCLKEQNEDLLENKHRFEESEHEAKRLLSENEFYRERAVNCFRFDNPNDVSLKLNHKIGELQHAIEEKEKLANDLEIKNKELKQMCNTQFEQLNNKSKRLIEKEKEIEFLRLQALSKQKQIDLSNSKPANSLSSNNTNVLSLVKMDPSFIEELNKKCGDVLFRIVNKLKVQSGFDPDKAKSSMSWKTVLENLEGRLNDTLNTVVFEKKLKASEEPSNSLNFDSEIEDLKLKIENLNNENSELSKANISIKKLNKRLEQEIKDILNISSDSKELQLTDDKPTVQAPKSKKEDDPEVISNLKKENQILTKMAFKNQDVDVEIKDFIVSTKNLLSSKNSEISLLKQDNLSLNETILALSHQVQNIISQRTNYEEKIFKLKCLHENLLVQLSLSKRKESELAGSSRDIKNSLEQEKLLLIHSNKDLQNRQGQLEKNMHELQSRLKECQANLKSCEKAKVEFSANAKITNQEGLEFIYTKQIVHQEIHESEPTEPIQAEITIVEEIIPEASEEKADKETVETEVEKPSNQMETD